MYVTCAGVYMISLVIIVILMIDYFSSCMQIQEAESDGALRELALENVDFLAQCGYTRPIRGISLTDKVDLVHTISLQHVILNSLGELSDYRRGLDTLGVAHAMEQYPHILRAFFCTDSKEPLSSGKIINT